MSVVDSLRDVSVESRNSLLSSDSYSCVREDFTRLFDGCLSMKDAYSKLLDYVIVDDGKRQTSTAKLALTQLIEVDPPPSKTFVDTMVRFSRETPVRSCFYLFISKFFELAGNVQKSKTKQSQVAITRSVEPVDKAIERYVLEARHTVDDIILRLKTEGHDCTPIVVDSVIGRFSSTKNRKLYQVDINEEGIKVTRTEAWYKAEQNKDSHEHFFRDTASTDRVLPRRK